MDISTLQDYGQYFIDQIVFYIPRVLGATLILWIGFFIANRITAFIDRALQTANFSENLRPFLHSLSNVLLKLLVLFFVASVLGADLTGILAILAAAGFAIGLALQGSLGNFASGILILTLHPYKVSDWIQVDDKFGNVKEVGVFSTIVETPGKKTLIIPNSTITESVVTNFSRLGVIRLELLISMPYEESWPKVQKILQDTLSSNPDVLTEPAPEIGIHVFDTHNIQVIVRPYVVPDDFWKVTFNVNQAMKAAFHENGIKMAYSEGVEMGRIGN
jgi:small conductance mechanosensitive channel